MFVVTALKVKYICYDRVSVSLFHESRIFCIPHRPCFIFKHLKHRNCTAPFSSRGGSTGLREQSGCQGAGMGESTARPLHTLILCGTEAGKENCINRHQLLNVI